MSIGPGHWRIGPDRLLTLDRPRLLGILNVTPDSFSDGGQHDSPEQAADHAAALVEQGADIIDIGAESTRPGAQRISPEEQIRRAVPAIMAIRRRGIAAPISIDTTSSAVARAAIDAGATIINDVSAGTDDPAILELAAERSAGLILMHRLRPPEADAYSDRYNAPPDYTAQGGVVAAVRRFLTERAAAAESAGVRHDAIVLDPGLGFGKTVEQNLELARLMYEAVPHGHAPLSAASRKSFIGRVAGIDRPDRRIAASVAVTVAHYFAGVRLFRVHDALDHAHALALAAALDAPRSGF